MDEDAVTSPGGLPRWREISDTLRAAITATELPPGAQMPTEAQLARRFAVNRHTVRRALDDLARAGLIRTEQGRGSFVTLDVPGYEVGPRTRFSEWLQRHHRDGEARVLSLREATADAAVAAGLGVQAGERVVVMERLGLTEGMPVSLAQHWFSPAKLPGILAALQAGPTITAALARLQVADYKRQSTRVTARLPTASEAMLLQMPRAQPVLVCENVNVDSDGRAIEFGLARYPTPRVQIVFEP